MIRPLLPLVAALAVTAVAVAQTRTPSPAPALAPGEIVAAAPKADWVTIPASDLLVMDLAPPAQGPGQASAKAKPRRVVIQLMPPPFAQGWIGNIRKLAAAHWWDGLSINRVQDNYVVQWGDADGEDKAKARALPNGLSVIPEKCYELSQVETGCFSDGIEGAIEGLGATAEDSKSPSEFRNGDPYAAWTDHVFGWPIAMKQESGTNEWFMWPVHCYAMVGVGRDLSPNTGSGAELYAVIGHAPRHLDRNIALVGRVIEGIEHLSSLPRGTGALGFYETPEERTNILSIRLGSEVASLPAYEYLSTESETFARYADARANRRDPFFIKPAGGADICNIPVPVRKVK